MEVEIEIWVDFFPFKTLHYRQRWAVARYCSSGCGGSKGSALRLRLTGSVVQPTSYDDLLTYKAICSNYLSFVVTSMLVFHIATG